MRAANRSPIGNISTHAPLAGRDLFFGMDRDKKFLFQPTRPLRGATITWMGNLLDFYISTHAPLAGRDASFTTCWSVQENFNPRAPCGARPLPVWPRQWCTYFNPRAPCGARRGGLCDLHRPIGISTHAPLAGRDPAAAQKTSSPSHFNPRAPCGARRRRRTRLRTTFLNFNPRAPCGARRCPTRSEDGRAERFQPTRPLRGATLLSGSEIDVGADISTHAPLAGRDRPRH